MALKTMLRNLLSKYGIMSVEMLGAFNADHEDTDYEQQAQTEVDTNANEGVVIDVAPKPPPATQDGEGPGF